MPEAIDDLLAGILAPLHERQTHLDAELEEAQERVNSLREERRRVERVLSAAQARTASPKPIAKKGARKEMTIPSPESVAQIRDFLDGWGKAGRFKPSELIVAMNGALSHDTIRRALFTMHEAGELQLLETIGRTHVYRDLRS